MGMKDAGNNTRNRRCGAGKRDGELTERVPLSQRRAPVTEPWNGVRVYAHRPAGTPGRLGHGPGDISRLAKPAYLGHGPGGRSRVHMGLIPVLIPCA